MSSSRRPDGTRGFTLVELAVVVVLVGMVAAFAIPRFRGAVERERSYEAFRFLATVHAAQSRFHEQEKAFADDLSRLPVKLPTLEFFSVGDVVTEGRGPRARWSLSLTRSDDSSGYGNYTVSFDQDGFDPEASTIPDNVLPTRLQR